MQIVTQKYQKRKFTFILRKLVKRRQNMKIFINWFFVNNTLLIGSPSVVLRQLD